MNPRARLWSAVVCLAALFACSEPPSGDEKISKQSQALPWGQQQRLTTSDASPLGGPVDIIGTNPYLVAVGAASDASSKGAVYVFSRTGSVWAEQQKLTADDGAANDTFGASLAFQNSSTLVIGAPGDDSNKGAAYVFTRSGSTWSQTYKLTATGGVASDRLGVSVAGGSSGVLVGAQGRSSSKGAVFHFYQGNQLQEFASSDATNSGRFGRSLSMDGTSAIVGSWSVNAYVFTYANSTWTEQQKLTGGGGTVDWYSDQVAIAGNVAAVSSKYRYGDGAVYMFTRTGTTWGKMQELLASDTAESKAFGTSIALSTSLAGTLVVGSVPVGGDPISNVYFFQNAGLTTLPGFEHLLTEKQKVQERLPFEYFGSNVAIHERMAVVSASGAAYVFPEVLGTCLNCATGACVDGVCCNTACAGACDVCASSLGASTNGICTVLPAGSLGTPACGTLTCNGTSADCVNCTTDGECPEGAYCAGDGTCQAQKPQGASCDEAAGQDCKEASCRVCAEDKPCVDAVCCENDCDSHGCFACAGMHTGVADGTCAPVIEGKDPHDACEPHPGYPASCLADGECSAIGACREYATAGTGCGAQDCEAAEVSGFSCTGGGVCSQEPQSCGDYQCDSDTCGSSCANDADCLDSAYCTSKTCQPKLADGDACSAAHECTSGFCSDGFCCNSVCEGQCEACGEAGTAGTCTPVLGEPRAGRDACVALDPEDPCSVSVCDGKVGSRCAAFVGPEVTCRDAGCADGVATLSATCAGKGECPDAKEQDCTPFLCAGDRCSEGPCVRDADCVEGFRCESTSGTCMPRDTTACSEDGSLQINPDGTTEDCKPYICDGIACLLSCRNSADCASSYVCDTEASICTLAAAASEESGCGCRAATPSRGRPLLGALALLALAAYRRRSRQPSRARRWRS